jgi:hypothetical protein
VGGGHVNSVAIWIGDESDHPADPADWYDLTSDLVHGGCTCRLEAKPGQVGRGAMGPEMLMELAAAAASAASLVRPLVKYYEIKHLAKIRLKHGSAEIEIHGVTPDQAERLLKEFADKSQK